MKSKTALLLLIAASIAVCYAQHNLQCHSSSITLHITVDNNLRLYFDGVEQIGLPNADNWRQSDSVPLSSDTRVIGVQGTDDGLVRAGILASTNDGSIMTNSSWKCTSVYYKGWELVNFNDANWPQAYVIAVHQTYPWSLVSGIRTDAHWIWTRNFIQGDRVVYCRKRLGRLNFPLPICISRTLHITVDNKLRLFFDGVEKAALPNANDWRKADSVQLPMYARVIAVQGTDDGIVRAGILASTDDGYIMTNGSWKCTNIYYKGWELATYDDSAWPAAYVIAVHQTYPWSFVPRIRTDAHWIWTRNFIEGDGVVYCRMKLLVNFN